MAELGVELVSQASRNKVASAQEILDDLDLAFENVCYIGDDLTDLALIKLAGFGVTVADGASELKATANFVTDAAGGEGAIRELVELILKQQNRWEETISSYTN
jgi:YrbI family 3-deoxy-D-manno-octulosonate 8-phosphate phosphatase